jgi:tetratricopeptide (TPR) repeat protein
LYLAQGDLAAAEWLGQRHVAKYPHDSAARLTLGMAYLRRGRVTDARREISTARKQAPADPAAAASLAQTYIAEKNWTEAERQLETAMSLDPGSLQTLGQLADFWAARNQPQRAAERIQRFLKTYPDVAGAHLFLGAAQAAAKDYPAAQAALERAIQLDPALMPAYVRLGQLYQQQGQTRAAIARYEKALEVRPGPHLCTLIGNLHASEGNLEAARKYYERALSLDRTFEVAAANLAWVQLQEGGNLDTALDMARNAVARYPDVVPIRDTLGWILYKKELHAQAATHLEECVRRAPDTALYHYHLAKVRVALVEYEKASAHFTDALRLNLTGPEAEDARRELAKLK